MINYIGRVPPQAIEAEKSILGCILVESSLIDSIIEELQPSDFYREDHKQIFESMLNLNRNNQLIDIVTLENELGTDCEKVGGYTYLVELASKVPTTAGYKNYCKIIRDKSIYRQLIRTSTEIVNSCYDETLDASEALDKAEIDMLSINNESTSSMCEVGEISIECVQRLETRRNNKSGISGLDTGFRDINFKIAGLQKGNLIIVAGRPAMGKSAFANNVAEHVGIALKQPVAIFNLEMSKEEVTDRMICSQAEINSERYKTGMLNDAEWSKMADHLGLMHKSPIFIDDTAGTNVQTIYSKCRKLKKEKGLSLVVVDYLQLITGDPRKQKTQDITDISRALKIMAKGLNVPVIALSQVSRGPEARENKRPMLSDLRESGAIEQDADIVMFLYRDEYYNPDTEKKGVAECIIAKHRTGSTGTVELTWEGKYTKFGNIPFEYRKVGKY